jgi:hypothetical protein
MTNPNNATICPKCPAINAYEWTEVNTEQCRECGNVICHCSSCGLPFPPTEMKGDLCRLCHKEQYGEKLPSMRQDTKWLCDNCGSDDITRSSPERFDVERQRWTEESCDNANYNCGHCADECDPFEVDVDYTPRYGCPSCGADHGDQIDDHGTTCRNCGRGVIEWTNKPKEDSH